MSIATEQTKEVIIIERYGQVDYAMLPFLVRDISAPGVPSTGAIAAEAVANPVIPLNGAPLDSQWWPLVKCGNRRVRGIERQNNGLYCCRVECEFNREYPMYNRWPLQGSGSLVQKAVTKRRDGTPLQIKIFDANGALKTVGVELNVLVPVGDLVIATTEDGNDPEIVKAAYVNKVNEHPWRGKPAKEWLCTGAEYVPIQTLDDNCRWAFTWHFKHQPGGHIYSFAYRDPELNATPQDHDGSQYTVTMDDWHETALFSVGFPDS